MTTLLDSEDNPKVPKIIERKDIILLSASIECSCGRTKERAHCPICGKIKLYGMADTTPAKLANGDVVNNCKIYRCTGCGEKFNDVDWYFNCNAPKKIDWEATKKSQQAQKKIEAQEKWIRRILMNEKFEYNDRTKCKAETGLNLEELRDQYRALERAKRALTPEQRELVENQALIIRGLAEPAEKKDTKKELEDHIVDCNYCNSHVDLCPKGQEIQNG